MPARQILLPLMLRSQNHTRSMRHTIDHIPSLFLTSCIPRDLGTSICACHALLCSLNLLIIPLAWLSAGMSESSLMVRIGGATNLVVELRQGVGLVG